jgi:AbrB family looped-hinge helix DNA binding protein
MARKKEGKSCCTPDAGNMGKIESLVTVDERGQMVLSKTLREKADIRPGEKLAVTTWERDGKVCCITLIKIEAFGGVVKNILGSVVGLPKK